MQNPASLSRHLNIFQLLQNPEARSLYREICLTSSESFPALESGTPPCGSFQISEILEKEKQKIALQDMIELHQDILMRKAFQQGRDEMLAKLSLCAALEVGGTFQETTMGRFVLSTKNLLDIPSAFSSSGDNSDLSKELNDNRNFSNVMAQNKIIETRRSRGGVVEHFPERLHRLLNDMEIDGKQEIVSFFPHGRAFAVHNPALFVAKVLPKYFSQTRLSSFQRQLNLYGFVRIRTGSERGGYHHDLFLKHQPHLCHKMRRINFLESRRAKEQSQQLPKALVCCDDKSPRKCSIFQE